MASRSVEHALLQTARASAFKKRPGSRSVTIMVFNRLLKTRFKKPLLAAIEPEDANRKNRRQIQNQTIRYERVSNWPKNP